MAETIALFFLLSQVGAAAHYGSMMASALNSISGDELYRHVEVLADDVYEGRAAGSRGGRAAGQYVLDQLKQTGLVPSADESSLVQPFQGSCRNVLVLLPGDDPQLQHEVVVVGAHYDHVGYGKNANSFGPHGKIHNGADDNASGTSTILETIEAFAISGLRTRRSILFAFWDAEEQGMLGSHFWLEHPTVPLENVKLSLTVDMVGRLREQRLQVLGTRSGYGLRRLLCDSEAGSIWLDFSWELSANSDHWPFLERGIPVALIHTGLHSDYHRPTDDVEKVNRQGMQAISRYLFATVVRAANEDQLPRFRGAVKNETETMRRELERASAPASLANWPPNLPPPRVGITWREDDAEPGAVLLSRVVTGSPAASAGLQVGDRIYECNGHPFVNSAALHQTITVHLDAGRSELHLLTERRGHLQPVTVRIAPDIARSADAAQLPTAAGE